MLNITRIKKGKCINKKTGKVIKALIAVHVFGIPCKILELKKICKEFNLILIEDAAEAIGSFYKGKHLGLFGDSAILSFNGNKTITTGGGGVILTNDEIMAKRAKHITTTAKLPHRWEYHFSEVGYNYRMPNLNAALGLAQLENLPKFLSKKRKLFKKYVEIFKKIKGITIKKEPTGCKSNYWLQTLMIDEKNKHHKDILLEITNKNKIMTRPCWKPMHQLVHFKDFPRMDLSVAEDLYSRLINLPSSSNLI